MLGYRADALDIMHAADVVCLTSAVEALPMCAARGDVGRPAGGRNPRRRCADAVVDGETGVLVAPGLPGGMATALVALARDRRAAEAGRPAGQRQQRPFSIEAMTRGYADLLESRPGSTARGCSDEARR